MLILFDHLFNFYNMTNLNSAIVITPTIGKVDLKDAMDSVRNQTYSDILHLIVIDGEQYESKVFETIKDVAKYNFKTLTLPWNTGADQFNGHRIFAALGFLINENYILFLDDDNWFHKDHVRSLINCIEKNHLDWAFSLRKIYSPDKNYICQDNCESIGDWPTYSGMAKLVDTSCYCLKREVLINAGYSWMEKYFGDRTFFNTVKRLYPNFKSSGLYTLNYKISNNNHPKEEFFLKGNEYMSKKYTDKFPWLNS